MAHATPADEEMCQIGNEVFDYVDTSTTAGEESGLADTESGLSSSDGGDVSFQVGFWRFGIRINRPRTPPEMRARRGGTGEIRMKRKQERWEMAPSLVRELQ